MPLAWREMSREDSARYAYTLMAAEGELLVIVQMMNSHRESLHDVVGKPVAIPIIEVEPEELDFDENLHNN